MFFPVITKDLNWENLTMNLVTFKRSNGVKDANFKYLWFKVGLEEKRGGDVFDRLGYPNAHYV